MTKRQPGWYPDPFRRHQQRYHDDAGWTKHVSDNGRQSTDATEPSADASGARPGGSMGHRFGLGPPAAPAYQPTTPRRGARAERGTNLAKAIAALSAAAVILGSLLPWAEVSTLFFSVTKDGTDGDGVITLSLAAAAILLLVVSGGLVRAGIVAVLGVAIGVIAVIDIADVQDRFSDIPVGLDASVGVGLWFVLAGAIGIVLGGAMLSQKT